MGLQGLAQENEEYRKELEYFKNKSSRQMKEIERLTAESTKWESKYYEEAKKNDKAIEYINNKEFIDYKKGLGNFERMLQHKKDLSNILKGADKE